MKPFTRWQRFLVWLGIIRKIDDLQGFHVGIARAVLRRGGICDGCRKQCIENCGGTCYCNVYTGACYCQDPT